MLSSASIWGFNHRNQFGYSSVTYCLLSDLGGGLVFYLRNLWVQPILRLTPDGTYSLRSGWKTSVCEELCSLSQQTQTQGQQLCLVIQVHTGCL